MSAGEALRIPLVLLPGTLCDARLWTYQVRHLAKVADPLIGDLAGADSIEALAAAVLAVAPPRFALAGLSMGGIVAFEILRRAPGRVLGVALLNTTPSAPSAAQRTTWEEEICLARNGHFASFVEQRWVPALLAASGSRGGLLRDVIRAMVYAVGPESGARQLSAQLGRPDSWPLLPTVTCPALVIGGREDTLCPAELHEAMAAALPNARLAIVEDCGHLSALERPEEVTVLLHAWLTQAVRHDAACERADDMCSRVAAHRPLPV